MDYDPQILFRDSIFVEGPKQGRYLHHGENRSVRSEKLWCLAPRMLKEEEEEHDIKASLSNYGLCQ